MLHSSIVAVFWGSSHTIQGQRHEVPLNTKSTTIPVRITNRREQTPMSGNNFGRRRIISNYDNSVGIRKTNRSILNKKARGHWVQNCVRICNEKTGGKKLGNRTMPNVLLLNARSLVNKVNEQVQIANHNSDITFVTETWLVDRVPDEAFNCSGQNIIRKDRPNGKGGGGIAVYVNDRIPIKLRDDLNNSAYECLWVTIRPNWLPRSISKITLCCV